MPSAPAMSTPSRESNMHCVSLHHLAVLQQLPVAAKGSEHIKQATPSCNNVHYQFVNGQV